MLTIIKQTFKEQTRSIFYYGLGLFACTWIIIGLFPYLSHIKTIYFQQIPAQLLRFLGAANFQNITTIEGLLSVGFLSFFFILIITFYIGSSAGAAIAGEIEKKTIYFQLSQPVSRIKWLISKSIVSILSILALVFSTCAVTYLLGKVYHADLSIRGLLAFFITACALLLAIYAIAIFLSTIMKSKIAVVSATIAVVIFFDIFTHLANNIDKVKCYEKYSLFHFYDPQKLLETGIVNITQLEILMAIFVVGLFVSIIVFNQKDI